MGIPSPSLKHGPAHCVIKVFSWTYSSIHIGRTLVIRVSQHGDDTEQNGLHCVYREPALLGLLVPPLVFPRLVQNRDTHITILLHCTNSTRTENQLPSLTTPTNHWASYKHGVKFDNNSVKCCSQAFTLEGSKYALPFIIALRIGLRACQWLSTGIYLILLTQHWPLGCHMSVTNFILGGLCGYSLGNESLALK